MYDDKGTGRAIATPTYITPYSTKRCRGKMFTFPYGNWTQKFEIADFGDSASLYVEHCIVHNRAEII